MVYAGRYRAALTIAKRSARIASDNVGQASTMEVRSGSETASSRVSGRPLDCSLGDPFLRNYPPCVPSKCENVRFPPEREGYFESTQDY